MKTRILILALFVAAATSARAGSVSYAQCGTYDAYLLIYKSTDRFEELGKLRCDEKVEVLSVSDGYSQIRTLDGRVGWVRDTDLSGTPPPPHQVFTFGMTEHPENIQPNPVPVHLISFLNNEDIVAMNAKHSGPDPILKRISSSHCAFDTSPEAIRALRAHGVPDKVILAMLGAPVASETPDRRAPQTVAVRIPDGTAVDVELSGNVSSDEVQDGAIVKMSAAEDLVVNGVPIIVRGSSARARIMAFEQPGLHGGSGMVAWFMQDIVTVGGDHLPVTFASKQPGNYHPRSFEGYPFLMSEYRKGSPAIKATDAHFRVVVHGDAVLNISQPLTADLPAPKPKTKAMRQVSTEPPAQPEAAAQPSTSEGLKP